MTIQKAVSAEEKAKQINEWMITEMGLNNLTDSNLQTYLTEQIKLAQEEARAETKREMQDDYNESIKQNRDEAYAQGFSAGQVAMREKIAYHFEEKGLGWLSDEIRALHPKATEGK